MSNRVRYSFATDSTRINVSSRSFLVRQKNMGYGTPSMTEWIVYSVANPRGTTRYVPSANSSVAIDALNLMSAEAKIRTRDASSSPSSLLSKIRNELSGCSGETGVAVTRKCSGMMKEFLT